MSDDDLCCLTATRALELVGKRELSPVELLEAKIWRAGDKRLHRHLFRRSAAAGQSGGEALFHCRRGAAALEGLPVVVKDAQRVAGRRTTYGSLLIADNVDDHSDPMIERLIAAGAIIHTRPNLQHPSLQASHAPMVAASA